MYYTYIYIHTHIYASIYIYIYIYIYICYPCICCFPCCNSDDDEVGACVCMYICIYTYMCIECPSVCLSVLSVFFTKLFDESAYVYSTHSVKRDTIQNDNIEFVSICLSVCLSFCLSIGRFLLLHCFTNLHTFT